MGRLKKYFSAFCGVALVFSVSAAQSEAGGPYIKKHSRPPSVKLDEPPKLDDANSFSMILLGDPQSYVKFDFNQPLFEFMTAWCAAQKDKLNVKTVLCTGDLVEQNDIVISNGGNLYGGQECGNQPSSLQWKSVSRAFERLDNIYPYIVATGNHDYGYDASETRQTQFGKYFDVSRNNILWSRHLISAFPNSEGRATLENSAYEFPAKNWGKIIVLVLEFSPRDEVLEWAKKLCSRKEFSSSRIIVLTHAILNTKGELITKDKYKAACNSGKEIFDKFMSQCPNVKLAICGHAGNEKTMASFRIEKRADGGNLPIMMFNSQAISGWNGNGGDCWLRILEFKPDGKTLSVKTYSPLFAASQKTQHLAWEKSPEHEFDIEIEK